MKKPILATLLLFVFALIWNMTLHSTLFAEINEAVASLRRDDVMNYMPLSLIMTLLLCASYVYGFTRFVKENSLKEAVSFGLFFSVLAILLVNVNQFIQYPIPLINTILWSLVGIVEFVLYALILYKLNLVSPSE